MSSRGGRGQDEGGNRGGERGGRGRGEGGYRGGERGGRGRGEGGYRGGERGGRGRGEGGYRGGERGGRGRGVFGGGGAGRANQLREKDVITAFAQGKKYDCPLEAWSNFLPFYTDREKVIFIYLVSYEMKDGAEVLVDRVKEKACEELLRKMKKETGEKTSFDFAQCVCTGQAVLSPERLPIEEFTYEFKVEKRGRRPKQSHYVVRISELKPAVLQVEEHRTEINTIIGKAVQVCYKEKNGSKYIDLSQGRESSSGRIATFDGVIPKVCTATIKGKEMTVLQIDTCVVVASAQNCLQVIEDIKRREQKNFKRGVMERFVKAKVCTMLNGGKGDLYTVLDVAETKAGDPANLKKNPQQTFVGYFLERYGMNIDPNQTVFRCRTASGKTVCIPPEVLYEMSVSDADKRQLPQLCSLYPNDRAERVKRVLRRLETEENGKAVKFLKAFGLSFGNKFLFVNGRVLKPVEVLIPKGSGYKSVQTLGDSNQQGFVKELRDLKHPGERQTLDFVVYDETRRGEALLNTLSKHLDTMNAGVRLGRAHYINRIGEVKNTPQKNVLGFAFLKVPEKDSYRALKAAWAKRGIVSQVVAKDLSDGRDAPIVMAVSQQVSAKDGKLNWVLDVNKLCPSLSSKTSKLGGILVIGADIGSEQQNIRTETKSKKQDFYTVAFVAFYVRGSEWSPYSNHYQVNGRQQTVFASNRDAEEMSSTEDGEVAVPSEVLSEKIKVFLPEARRHFADKGLNTSAILILRGCASEGELVNAKQHDAAFLGGALKGNLPCAVVAAQRYQHTRFGANTPSEPNVLCNVPRGFVTEEATDKKFGEAFFLNGANCTLGHARSTLYAVLHRTDSFELRELQSLLYGMGFLYPNKTDGLPLPLPLKCAAEYARKFVGLREVQVMPESMRTKLHFL